MKSFQIFTALSFIVLGNANDALALHASNGNGNDNDNAYFTPSRKPSLSELITQKIQISALQRPNGLLASTLLPIVSFIEQANPLLIKKREAFGPNFCNSGTVVLSEWDQVEQILTTIPQARTFRLGTGFLNAKRLPMMVGGEGQSKRNVWFLSLDQRGAGGDGMHEAVRSVFIRYFTVKALQRQNDSTARALLDQLVKDYKVMDHGLGGAFFRNSKRGFLPFVIKYIHYCLYGIDPSDKKKFRTLYGFYFGNVATKSAAYYFSVAGTIFNVAHMFKFNRLLPKVAQIYEDSPSMMEMPDEVTSFKLTKNEVAHMTIPIMSIAATLGPRDMIQYAMGADKLPNHNTPGVHTDKIDVCSIWDSINLDDRDEVVKYIYEVNRLRPPVGHSHHVAVEDFTVKILGKDRTFPKGTVILIPISLTMLDKNKWGSDVHEFNLDRRNLVDQSMIFHSVGNKTNGRMCPGKEFGLNMSIQVVTECGKARRQMVKANIRKSFFTRVVAGLSNH